MRNYVSPVVTVYEFEEDIITASNLSDALLDWSNDNSGSSVAELDKSELSPVAQSD